MNERRTNLNQVFFSRPGKIREISDLLINDIKNAKTRILVSSAYFTDRELAEAIIGVHISEKRVIFNRKEVEENANNNYPFKKIYNEIKNHCQVTMLGSCRSLMHHKFIIIDKVLWTGSYNFSKNAREYNWENIIRIDERELVKQFSQEFECMWRIGEAVNVKLIDNICQICNNTVLNPMSHFLISLNVWRTEGALDWESNEIALPSLIDIGYNLKCLSNKNGSLEAGSNSNSSIWTGKPHCEKCMLETNVLMKINYITMMITDDFPFEEEVEYGVFCPDCFREEETMFLKIIGRKSPF